MSDVRQYMHADSGQTLGAYAGTELDSVLAADPAWSLAGDHSAPEPKPEPGVPESEAEAPEDGDELPDGVEDHGGGWYTVDGEKVHGRKALDAALAARQG